MSIRRLTPKDLSAYRALWAEAVMQSPNSFLFSAEEVRAMPNQDVARGLEVNLTLGAFDDMSRLVGFVTARRGGPKRMRHMADVGHFMCGRPHAGRGSAGG